MNDIEKKEILKKERFSRYMEYKEEFFIFKRVFLTSDPENFEKECTILDDILQIYLDNCMSSIKIGTGISTCFSSKLIYKPTNSDNDISKTRIIKDILTRGDFINQRYRFFSKEKETEVKDYYKRIIEMYYYYCFGKGLNKMKSAFKKKYYPQYESTYQYKYAVARQNIDYNLEEKIKLKKNIMNLSVVNNVNNINNIKNIKNISNVNRIYERNLTENNKTKLYKIKIMKRINYNKLKKIKNILSEYKIIKNSTNINNRNSLLEKYKTIISEFRFNPDSINALIKKYNEVFPKNNN
jgi:hypothetical protein